MFKALGRSSTVQKAIARLAVTYLALVRRTNRMVVEPNEFPARVQPQLPVIGAMWHGQHFVAHFAWPRGARVAALISRHRDAELNARILDRMGVIPIRGSGGRAEKMRRRGGVDAAFLDAVTGDPRETVRLQRRSFGAAPRARVRAARVGRAAGRRLQRR